MRIWIPLLLLMLPLNAIAAQPDPGSTVAEEKSVQGKIARKIKMIDLILNSPDLQQRVQSSEDPVVADLMARAAHNFLTGEAYFERGDYLEAEAVLDYVLRDLSAGSRLLGRPQQKPGEYRRFVAQVDAFALPQWSGLSPAEWEVLQQEMKRVSQLLDRAAGLADEASWDDAIELLEQAYRIKVSLLERFRHAKTIVYDLDFDTVQDEYRYLIDRTYHYLELVRTVLAQNEIDPQIRKLTERYFYDSMLGLESAEDYEAQGRFAEAIPVLNNTIELLNSVLKILGVTI